MPKPKFNLEKYNNSESYVMFCQNRKEAETFLRFLDSKGMSWNDSHDSYLEKTLFEAEYDYRYYMFKDNAICCEHTAKVFNCIVLNFSDYDWTDFQKPLKSQKYVKKEPYGKLLLGDYRELYAKEHGYSSYKDFYMAGNKIGKRYDVSENTTLAKEYKKKMEMQEKNKNIFQNLCFQQY